MSRTATLVEAAAEAATAPVEIATGAALAEAVAAALAEEGQETGSARAVETTTLLGTPTAGGAGSPGPLTLVGTATAVALMVVIATVAALTATLAVVIAMAETGEEATVAAALVEEGQETGSARTAETSTLLGTPTAGGVVTRAEQGKTHGAFGRTRRALAWSRRVPLNVVKENEKKKIMLRGVGHGVAAPDL